ncbi:hypothetical protein [Acanthopleuribacter pedis]|uniref:Uncharacterized protein n=1 Tax=Acanthopleuribacter pedis TaxID=442870 RepID=A0A8J7U741_9BACT|nr:hypothetical protein [Acanthopleuribacter pedis]MBO1321021.1 hypothetical protein [Acanthopleuribacter pedis]
MLRNVLFLFVFVLFTPFALSQEAPPEWPDNPGGGDVGKMYSPNLDHGIDIEWPNNPGGGEGTLVNPIVSTQTPLDGSIQESSAFETFLNEYTQNNPEADIFAINQLSNCKNENIIRLVLSIQQQKNKN